MICHLWERPQIGIPCDDDHLFFSWKGKVFFSATRRGGFLDCHVAAKGVNKLLLREAINQFCQFAFSTYAWCKAVTACVKLKSVKNLCLNCGFVKVMDLNECEVMMKWAV